MDNARLLARKLFIKFPILQAPMAGGSTSPALAAAVSNAGGLGSIAGGYLSPDKLRAEIKETRTLTKSSFAVNLFTPLSNPVPTASQFARANALLDPYRKELGLGLNPPAPEKYCEDLTAQLQVVLEERPSVFTFTFGMPPESFLHECKNENIVTIGTATHIEEAVALEKAGVDMVFAQGYEAGGHRGTFIGDFHDARIGLTALVPQLVQAVKIPVIAAGGIMHGSQVAAALAMGASGVSLGTAFLLCPEASTNQPYRATLKSPDARFTEVSRVYSGRYARGIRNRFMVEMEKNAGDIPEYPIQNAMTREIRTASAKAGKADFLSLFAGQGVTLIRELPAKELVETLIAETFSAVQKVQFVIGL
ncbi:probable nitronate monooxygenase [Paramacrobiotus metropolitanus]|uniref:probable nitronate monooxygenase n=1 Tax=Paramacrobiotus metropolitanus TaxID=2943436 RepID=UPI002445FBAA|nr:probable nitronate monooxygenase [Paramacrobiotus metropolitanus]XP_055351291.1 probable nitronate monooxygenase [Paramacrobiotus metropolitanus]